MVAVRRRAECAVSDRVARPLAREGMLPAEPDPVL